MCGPALIYVCFHVVESSKWTTGSPRCHSPSPRKGHVKVTLDWPSHTGEARREIPTAYGGAISSGSSPISLAAMDGKECQTLSVTPWSWHQCMTLMCGRPGPDPTIRWGGEELAAAHCNPRGRKDTRPPPNPCWVRQEIGKLFGRDN